MVNLLLVGLGGFFGSLTRFYLAQKFNKRLMATWIANISGAIILACMIYLYQRSFISETLWLFSGIGFSGAYTTFSTFGQETLTLLLDKEYKQAFLYVGSSFGVAILIVFSILYLFTS